MKVDYIIDGDNSKLRLKNVDSVVRCKRCTRILIFKSGKSVLLKTQISVVTEHGYVLRCGGCRSFNVIEGKNHQIAI